MRAALELDKDPVDVLAATMLPWEKPPKVKAKGKPGELPLPGCHSEWAECGVLATGWSAPDSARLAYSFQDQTLRVELAAFGRLWLQGEWDFQLHVDGQPLGRVSSLEELCRHEDKDVDYLELEASFSSDVASGWRIQRQLLLDRRHQIPHLGLQVLAELRPLAAEATDSYDEDHKLVSLRYMDGKIAQVLDNQAIMAEIA